MSQFARMSVILDEEGNPQLDKNGKTVCRAYVTKTVTLNQGDSIFFNPPEEVYERLTKYEKITATEASEKLSGLKEMDVKYNRDTRYFLNSVPAKPKV